MEVLTAHNTFHHHLHLLPTEVLQALELAARWGTSPETQAQIQSIVSQLFTVGEIPKELKNIAPDAFYSYLNRPVIEGVVRARNIPLLDIPFLGHAITVLAQFLSNVISSNQSQAGPAFNQTMGSFSSWGGSNMYPGYNPQPQFPYAMSGGFQGGNVMIPTPNCNYCGVKINPGNAVVQCMTCSPIGNSHDTCTKCVPTRLPEHCGHRVTVNLPGYDKATTFVCTRCQSPIGGVRYQCRQCSEERGDSWNLCQGCITQSPCASHLLVLWKQNSPTEPQEIIQFECSSCGAPLEDLGLWRLYPDLWQAMCETCSSQAPQNGNRNVLITKTMISCFSNLYGVRCEMCAGFITSFVFLRCITCGTDLVGPYNLCLLCAMATGPSLHAGHDMVVSRGSHGCDGCAKPIHGARYQCRDCSLGAKRREGNAWDLCRGCVRNSCLGHQVKLYCASMLGQPLIERRMECNGCSEPLNDNNPFWHCLECMDTEWCYNCVTNVPDIIAHSQAHPIVRLLDAISDSEDKACNECMQTIEYQTYISCQTCGTYNEHGFNICAICIPSAATHHVMHQTKIREPQTHEKEQKDKEGSFACVNCGSEKSNERYQCLDCSSTYQGSHNLCLPCLHDSDCNEHTLVVWNYDREDHIWLRKNITCLACSSHPVNGKPFYLCLTCGKNDSILCPPCKAKRGAVKGHNSRHHCVEILDAARPEQRKPSMMCCDSCISYIGDNGSSTFFQCIECTGHNEHSVDLCTSCVIHDAGFHKGHTFFLGA